LRFPAAHVPRRESSVSPSRSDLEMAVFRH